MTVQARYRKLHPISISSSGGGGRVGAPGPGNLVAVASSALADPNPSLLMDGDDFESRFASFKKNALQEQKQQREATAALCLPKDPTQSGSQDSAMVELGRTGGPGLLDGLRQTSKSDGIASPLLVDRFHWKLPLVQFARAVLNSPARLDDDLRFMDLEHQWGKLHELIQHEKQDPMTFGDKKPFLLSTCARLGTCVCSRNGKAAAAMCQFLMSYVKRIHPGTMKQPSPERERFVKKLCVLELSSKEISLAEPPSLDAQVLYLHCGYTNFSTWETTCTRLHLCFYNRVNGPLVFCR